MHDLQSQHFFIIDTTNLFAHTHVAGDSPYRPSMLSRLLTSTPIISRDVIRGALRSACVSWQQHIATGLQQPSTPNGTQNPVQTHPPSPATASGVVLHTVFDEADHQETHHPLLQYRAAYPDCIWTKIHQATPRSSQPPLAVDLGIGTGRGAIELAKRGFRVIGIESSSNLMASTHHSAAAAGVAVDLIPATLEVRSHIHVHATTHATQGQLLPAHAADVVTVLHGLHLVPTEAALEEAHRLLRPKGLLVAAWNDRDQSSPFIQELESLMENFNSEYSRHHKQRDVAHWGEVLQGKGLFRLLEYSVHPNPLRLRGAAPLLDILDCLTFMRHSRRPSAERRALHGRVIDLVQRCVSVVLVAGMYTVCLQALWQG